MKILIVINCKRNWICPLLHNKSYKKLCPTKNAGLTLIFVHSAAEYKTVGFQMLVYRLFKRKKMFTALSGSSVRVHWAKDNLSHNRLKSNFSTALPRGETSWLPIFTDTNKHARACAHTHKHKHWACVQRGVNEKQQSCIDMRGIWKGAGVFHLAASKWWVFHL